MERKLQGAKLWNESTDTHLSDNSYPVSFANNLRKAEGMKEPKQAPRDPNTSAQQAPKDSQQQHSFVNPRQLLQKIYQSDFPEVGKRRALAETKGRRSNNTSNRYLEPSAQLPEQNGSDYFKTKEDIIRSIYMPKTQVRFRTAVKSSMSNRSFFGTAGAKQQAVKQAERDREEVVSKECVGQKPLQTRNKASRTARSKFHFSSTRMSRQSQPRLDLSQVLNSMPRFEPKPEYATNFPKLFDSNCDSKLKQHQQSSESQQETVNERMNNPRRTVMRQHLNLGEEGVHQLIRDFQPNTMTYQKMDKSGFKIKKYKNGVYFGQLSEDQKKDGVGIVFYYDGRLYEGEFGNDLKHGKGYQLYIDSSYYDGEYVQGYKEGKGRFVWNNGQIYDGQWYKGKKHGSGMWKASQTSRQSYIGQWFNGKPHGFGVYINQIGDRYEGEFKHGLKEGHGTQRFNNGDIYAGQFVKGRRMGVGQFRYANGDIYYGEFCNNLRHGKGKFIQFKTRQMFQGNYRNDSISGKGQYLFSDGAVYAGSFENGYIHGEGVITYRDDTFKEGYWINGIKIQEARQSLMEDQAMRQFAQIRQQRKKKLQPLSPSKPNVRQARQKQKPKMKLTRKSLQSKHIKPFVRKCDCLFHRRSS